MQRLKIQERKQDTRKKIQFGGLIKKAGLEDESVAILYGILLEAKELLDGPGQKNVRQRWKVKGDIDFTLRC